MDPLINRRFRANPAYVFVPREEFEGGEVPGDESWTDIALVYGYLVSCPTASLRTRPLPADTALLFLTLAEGGRIPLHFRAGAPRRAERFLRELVLDGVLEVESSGGFVSGAAAVPVVSSTPHPAKGPLAALSREAIRYADALGALPIPELTRRIYDFGRLPLSPALKRALGSRDSPVGADALEVRRECLKGRWAQPPVADSAWTMWRPIHVSECHESRSFKLYVSPGWAEVPVAFAAAAEVLGGSPGIRGMKVGRGAAGLTRPDKIVAYFSQLEDLQEAGWKLYDRVRGCSVHGVPLTAELSPDGLLSWGADPPRTVSPAAGSWRLWLARRLATHLNSARHSPVSGPGWLFALERLRLDGVNPEDWMPDPEFWSPPISAE